MLEKVATVLEKLAVYVDAVESEKIKNIEENREKLAELLRDKYEQVTGDTIDDETLRKLSNADLDVLATFDRITEAGNSDLGSPSDLRDVSAPLNKKEAAEAADETLLNWIMSSD